MVNVLVMLLLGFGSGKKVENEWRQLGVMDAVPELGVCWKLFKDQAYADNPDPSCWEHMFSKVTTVRQFDPNSTSAHFALALNSCNGSKPYFYVQYGTCDPYTLQRNPVLPCGFFDTCHYGKGEVGALLDGYGFGTCSLYYATPNNTEVWQFGAIPNDYQPPVIQPVDTCFGSCFLPAEQRCLPGLSLDKKPTTNPVSRIDYDKAFELLFRFGAFGAVVYGLYKVAKAQNQPIEMARLGQQD